MISTNITKIKDALPPHVTLVAVSKLQSVETILKAYHTGHRHFGENRPQEFSTKHPLLPNDIIWHFIGRLQTNKVKLVVGKAALIHSIDSLRLLMAVEREALKQGTVQDCLLAFHIAAEESKSGFSIEEVFTPEWPNFKAVRFCGVMGMASFTEDKEQIRKEFRTLKHYFDQIKDSNFAHNPHFCHLSMGMSNDWPIAIEEGSTLIRVGTQIFGAAH